MKTAEDHFTTGLIAGVIMGLLLGYTWKAIEGVSHGTAKVELVDCIQRGGPAGGVHLVRTDTRGSK